jgi:(p)ppGpp synthase/HD superfamily hydrolase
MTEPLILPPLRRTADEAAQFAAAVHAGQVDKAGNPYAEHLARVAAAVLRMSEDCPSWSPQERDDAVQIAWLHDTIEDTSVSADRLRDEGFGEAVVTGVCAITKPDGPVPYAEWIARLAATAARSTILVKLADVLDNSDPTRLAVLPEETQNRLLSKYEPAKDVLRASARRAGWQG